MRRAEKRVSQSRFLRIPVQGTEQINDGISRPKNGWTESSVMTAISGQEAGAVSFGTEAPWMAKLGADAVVFGPGTMRVAHGKDEQVPVAELEECVGMLRGVIGELARNPR